MIGEFCTTKWIYYTKITKLQLKEYRTWTERMKLGVGIIEALKESNQMKLVELMNN